MAPGHKTVCFRVPITGGSGGGEWGEGGERREGGGKGRGKLGTIWTAPMNHKDVGSNGMPMKEHHACIMHFFGMGAT